LSWRNPLHQPGIINKPSFSFLKVNKFVFCVIFQEKNMKLEEEMWWQNLEEWVLEDSLMVTYKYLARMINVHVNTAKKMLFTFHDRGKTEAVFLLAGRMKDGGGLHVALVHEDQITEASKDWSKITSKHVFSICKKTKSGEVRHTDTELLNADQSAKDKTPMASLSGIRNKKAIPRAAAVESLLVQEKVVEEAKPTSTSIKASRPAEEPKKEKKANNTKAKAPSKTKAQASAIAGMFAKAPPKKPTEKPPPQEVSIISSPENSPGKENKLNREKEEAAVKEAADKPKPKSHKRPKSEDQVGNNSKRRRRIQVASFLIDYNTYVVYIMFLHRSCLAPSQALKERRKRKTGHWTSLWPLPRK
jgi:hypothetical protein